MKACFPWDIGFPFRKPILCALISIFIFYNKKQKSYACKLQNLFKIPCKKDDFPKARSRMLMKPFKNKI